MLDLLEKVNLLEDLPLAEVVLHVVLFNCFDGYLLSSQFVNAQGDLSESSFADELHELVEVECGGRQLVLLLNVLLDVLDQVVSFLENCVVHLGLRLGASALVPSAAVV